MHIPLLMHMMRSVDNTYHHSFNYFFLQAITHIVEMRFNGENVRMSPWKIQVRTSQHPANSDFQVEERMIRSIESRRYDYLFSFSICHNFEIMNKANS